MKKLIYLLFLLASSTVFATHNRAGEITFSHISGLTYEIKVVTYTKASSPSDRPWLEMGICGPVDSIPRTSKVLITNDTYKNTYIAQHTFPGSNPSPCIISVLDPGRTAGSNSIPNSVNTDFYIQTELYINPFAGINNSPIFPIPPIDSACVNVIKTFNSGAVDVDGDSLYYSLQLPLGQGGLAIPSAIFPQASNSFSIDSLTGIVTWDTPINLTGLYDFDVLVEEFRNGIKIGSVLREIQIDVKPTCIVGIDEQATRKLNIKVYPNPFNNELTINYELQNKTAILEIYNLVGEQILTQKMTKNTTSINLTNLVAGIYFIKVIDGDSLITKKVIKQ